MSILPAPSATEVERLLIEFVSQMPLVPGRSDASHWTSPRAVARGSCPASPCGRACSPASCAAGRANSPSIAC